MNMNRALASVLPLLTLCAVAPAALAQGAPYNRGIDAASLTYAPAADGAGFEVAGDLLFSSDGAEDRDLSCVLTTMVNGAAVGSPQVVQLYAAADAPNRCASFCASCNGICFRIGRICFCITMGEPDPTVPLGRFALPVPPLHPGDVVSVSVTPFDGSLPEIDMSDDLATFTIGGTPCPADVNADGAVNSQDFFDFLGAFFAADPSADFNADGVLDSQDFFDFVGAFFTPC
jgi:hypothetical protein